MKRNVLFALILIVCNSVYNQDLVVNFDFNKYNLTDYAKENLLNKLSEFKLSDSLVITGYTDTVGSKQYNLELSRRRAKSVESWLLANNIDHSILFTKWKGEADIISTQNDSLNRRVEIYAYKKNAWSFHKHGQVFDIDNSKDTILHGKEGTMISIPAHSLIPPVSTGSENFHVTLTEYYKMPDIVLDNLTTGTSSGILETGGMIHLNIFQDGNPCTINKSNPIVVSIPESHKKTNDMNLFYGKANDRNEIIWKRSNTDISDSESESEVMFLVEDMPKFKGGDLNKFKKYVDEHIQYPQIAIDSNYCGRVFVSFCVDQDGKVLFPNIVRGSYSCLNAEALRVISSSPRWKPGRQMGRNVTVEMTMPVIFKLGNNCKDYIGFNGINAGPVSNINDSLFQKSNADGISYYTFSVLYLDWINCDRYIFKGKPRTNLKIRLNASGNISTHLIFTKYKSVLNGYYSDGYYSFNNVPENADVIVLCIKKMKGRIYLADKHFRISNKVETLDNFEEISFEDLQKKISMLDKEL